MAERIILTAAQLGDLREAVAVGDPHDPFWSHTFMRHMLDTVDAEEWMKATLKEVGGDVHIVKTSKATCSAYIKQDQASNR